MAKRGQGEGTISKRADGTYCGRLTVGRTPEGKQKRKAFYGKTKREVQEKMDIAKAELHQGIYYEPSKIKLSEWLETWLKDYKHRIVRESTFYRIYLTVNSHIIPHLGKYTLADLRTEHVQKYFNQLRDDGESAHTIKRCYLALSEALEQAIMNGYIVKNPVVNTIRPSIQKKEARVLSREEQEQFMLACKKSQRGSFFIFILGTGLRAGELLALTWNDIDFENQLVNIDKTVSVSRDVYGDGKKKIEIGEPKTLTSKRTVPLLPVLVEMLKQRKKEQEEYKLLYGQTYHDSNLIFCRDDGGIITSSSLCVTCKRIGQKVGLEEVHTHTLRHTFATRGLENGIELKVMQTLLGHSSIRMTADIYTHVLPDKKMDSIKKLEGTILL